MSTAEMSLELAYLSPAQLRQHQQQFSDRIMGVIGFGQPQNDLPAHAIVTWVNIPLLNADTTYEVWTSTTPVTHEQIAGISCSYNADLLFGCVEIAQTQNDALETLAFDAYCKIFDVIEKKGFSHLLRVWNYFPDINSEERDEERYRHFNTGRHDAFIAKGRHIGEHNVPAACALGSRSGPLIIYFLAGKLPGNALENPRQTSAYHYPEQFGPRSPTFSRAMLAGEGRAQQLFISGTASIVGHESLHPGDVAAQTRETLLNIRALLEQVNTPEQNAKQNLFLKVYLKHSDYLSQVREQITTEFGSTHQALYLQADVCRAELLLEIEAVQFSDSTRSGTP